ncbi:MAG TPA: transcription termination/antitermination protein NusG [Candidatus Limnocylindrales bacterium]|nr:transcription termination/antitermination protein NusG [Candidatus Limnocylindrales bacterium]
MDKSAVVVAPVKKDWYVIHTYAGYEKRVKTNLERRVDSMDMKESIFRIMVPTEKEIVSRGGQKKTVEKKVFPGYVLVEMVMNDDSWYVVRNTPGVTGFVGPGSKPVPLSEKEITQILRQAGVVEGKPRIDFDVLQIVRVVSGPFKNFEGKVEEINKEKGTVKVSISMFGRETPVELEFHQVIKF